MVKSKFDKLEEFVRYYMPAISKFLIYDTEDGQHIMFEQYSVKRMSSYISVIRYRDERTFRFNKIRHAVAWVVLDKNKKFYESNRLIELDLRLTGLEIDLLQHQRIKNSSKDLNQYMLMLNKIQHDVALQNKFQVEIDKYIIMANDCQLKGFEYELTRPSGK